MLRGCRDSDVVAVVYDFTDYDYDYDYDHDHDHE